MASPTVSPNADEGSSGFLLFARARPWPSQRGLHSRNVVARPFPIEKEKWMRPNKVSVVSAISIMGVVVT